MNVFLKIGGKLLLVAILLMVFNQIYKRWFFEGDLQVHSGIINLVRQTTEEKAQIVYFGESSNLAVRDNDVDKRSISDFVAEYFPQMKLGVITKEACHAGIYYELMRNIPIEAPVQTVVVTMNLRSFNANWRYSNLETALQKSVVLLKDNPTLWNRGLLAFKGYDIKTDEEREAQFKEEWRKEVLKMTPKLPHDNVIDWDEAMAKAGIRNATGEIDEGLTGLACNFIKTYAFQIDTLSNPRIHDFDRIVKLAHDRNWNVVFNLLAENTDKAALLVGKELVDLMTQNTELLVNRYQGGNVRVVNNLNLVRDEQFIDQNWTTEHYAELGRKSIAKNLAKTIAIWHPEQWAHVQYTIEKAYSFINDCEGKIKWSQMQTISNQQAFGGAKSSMTGKGIEYGVTFEQPIALIGDSATTVTINMQAFQESAGHDAKLTFVASGKDIESEMKEVLLTSLTEIENQWSKIEYTFHLPKDFYSREVVKVYLYNPSQTLIFIDNISVDFDNPKSE